MLGLRTTAAAIMFVAATGAAMAEGVIGTAEGELPFDGIYVKDVAALNVTAFRAAMTIDFRKVARIEFVEVDQQTQMATIRVTFQDSYAMPATFSIADNAPWVAIGAYGRANYSAENLLNGDVQYIQFEHDASDSADDATADTGN